MPIKITIPGLTEFITEIPDGNLILVEGSIDPIATVFVQHLALTAFQGGKDVNYITSRTEEEVREQMKLMFDKDADFQIVSEKSHRHWQDYITDNGVTIIDSFSYLNIERPLSDVRRVLEEFLSLVKQKEALVFITMERGMVEENVTVTCKHLCDGIFLFLSRDTDLGIRRYIRIPKWMNGKSFDENIYYHFDGKDIRVDLRSRVR